MQYLLFLLSVVFSVSASSFTIVEDLYPCISEKEKQKKEFLCEIKLLVERKYSVVMHLPAFIFILIAFGTMITPKYFLPYAK